MIWKWLPSSVLLSSVVSIHFVSACVARSFVEGIMRAACVDATLPVMPSAPSAKHRNLQAKRRAQGRKYWQGVRDGLLSAGRFCIAGTVWRPPPGLELSPDLAAGLAAMTAVRPTSKMDRDVCEIAGSPGASVPSSWCVRSQGQPAVDGRAASGA